MGFEVEEGNRVQFWVEDWLGMGLLPLSFPRLLQCCPINYLLLKIVMWEVGFVSCDVAFKKPCQILEYELLSLIFFICREESDTCI